jgi:hypothetical protein
MSLDFDLTEIDLPSDFYVEIDGEQRMHPKYQVIIMPGTLMTGIGTLTDDTIPEFYARFRFYELLNGALLSNQNGPLLTELHTVRAMRGLKTNVFPPETRAKWLKRQGTGALDDLKKHAEREISTTALV